MKNKTRPAMTARARAPPATPPAMAPTFEWLLEVGTGVCEVEVEVEVDTGEVLLDVGLVVVNGAPLISCPGTDSGVSKERDRRSVARTRNIRKRLGYVPPTACAAVELNRFTF